MSDQVQGESNNQENCAVCHVPADLKCSLCKLISYCCKEHQKSHWKVHKVDCRVFDVLKREGKGHYLAANRELPADQCILQEGPLLIGPTAEPICLGCLRPLPPSPPVQSCPSCAWPACSPRCRGLTSPTSHLPECIVLSKNKEPALRGDCRYEAILPLRCLLLQKINPKKFHHILGMECFIAERKKNKEVYNEAKENIVKYLTDNYLKYLEGDSVLKDTSSVLIHQIAAIIDMNGLEVSSSGVDIMVMYPTFYQLDHSCLPNTKYTIKDNLRISVFTTKKIESGEWLTSMYSNALWGTIARRQQLKSERQFDCKCARCSDPSELGTHTSSLQCVHSIGELSCNGYLLPLDPLDYTSDWHCTKCDAMLDTDQVNQLTLRIGEQVEEALKKASVAKLEDLVKNLEKLLHKNHYHCYKVKHSLMQLYGREKGFLMENISDEDLNRKIALCNELLSVNKALDPSYCTLHVYTAVIEHELYLGWLEKTRRGQSNVSRAAGHLARCVELLATELPGTAGANLSRLASAELKALQAKSAGIKII